MHRLAVSLLTSYFHAAFIETIVGRYGALEVNTQRDLCDRSF